MPKVIANEVILKAEADAMAKGAYEKGIREGKRQLRRDIRKQELRETEKRGADMMKVLNERRY